MNTASRDKAILLFGLITYGMGQSLLYVIFGPLARDIGLTEQDVASAGYYPLSCDAAEKLTQMARLRSSNC